MIQWFRNVGFLVSAFLLLWPITFASAQTARTGRAIAKPASSTSCEDIRSRDLSGLQDAPTQVLSSRVVAASGDVPAHCEVSGFIAPQIGFELRLPTATWNSKFMEVGCGGYCGTMAGGSTAWCLDAVRRGYACIITDQGHKGIPERAIWAYNNLQAKFDWGIRASHVASVVGKAISQVYYGRTHSKAYFMGCSGGGRQALVEAQLYPDDFDGIIAMDPSNPMCTGVVMLWNALATNDGRGQPLFSRADLDLLHQAVLNQCDRLDGLKDGLLTDPRVCRFDPQVVECKPGQTANCLSNAQVAAARKVYDGPRTSAGRQIYPPSMPGSELGGFWAQGVGYKTEWWRYMGFFPDPGPIWKASDFNFDEDYKRLGTMQSIFVPNNPDLREFRARGGKLILIQGWDDSGSPLPLNTIDYYQMVERISGGPAEVRTFARLFMIPGMAHCIGGSGAGVADYLSYLENWVENGKAPDMIIGAHVEGSGWAETVRWPNSQREIGFTRPHYAYPIEARYKGGDPNDYRSFKPVVPR